MDGDLQDPPESIPLVLEKYTQGYDVVYARRVRRSARRTALISPVPAARRDANGAG
jgi:dolichol-phosphate mannosyltransferase